MMKNEIKEYIINQASEKLNELKKNGYIIGGKNGPYDDNETPVRVCSHWIQIFSFLYKETKNEEYYNAIKILSNYLTSQNIEKTYYSYSCRDKEGKDHVNGTIGQAWVIEGLVEASRILKDDSYYELAVKMFLNHKFDKKMGLWNRFEIDGRELGFDGTFNHQLWFAAAGAEIIEYKNNEEIKEQINIFLDKCQKNDLLFRIHRNGTICHYSCISNSTYNFIYYCLREAKNKIKKIIGQPNMQYKEEGYHYFALYGFAILKENFGKHEVFNSKKLTKAIKYALSEDNYIRQLNISPTLDGNKLASKIGGNYNIYCFPYNSPFYELPYIAKIFKNDNEADKLLDKLWEIHKENFLDQKNINVVNSNDPITLIARIYELLRIWR